MGPDGRLTRSHGVRAVRPFVRETAAGEAAPQDRPGLVSRAIFGPLDAVEGDPRLAEYQPYWAARAGILARTSQIEAADAAYRRAIGLEADPAVRRFLQARREALRTPNENAPDAATN
jgi:hypothetical protein